MNSPDSLDVALSDLADYLEKYGVGYAKVLKDFSVRLSLKSESEHAASERERVCEELRRLAFGGMGSLSDVWISQRNRHRVKSEDEDAVNRDYQSLLVKLKDILDESARHSLAT